jgi:hypothetical protein
MLYVKILHKFPLKAQKINVQENIEWIKQCPENRGQYTDVPKVYLQENTWELCRLSFIN